MSELVGRHACTMRSLGVGLDVAANHQSSEHGECAARFGVNLGGHATEGCELLRIEQHLVDALRRCLVVNLWRREVRSLLAAVAGASFIGVICAWTGEPVAQSAQSDGNAGEHLAAR